MNIDLHFVSKVPDVSAFRDLMKDYYETVLPGVCAIGGPSLSAAVLADGTIEKLDDLLPPENRLLLGWGTIGDCLRAELCDVSALMQSR
jgi:hypothetical protein